MVRSYRASQKGLTKAKKAFELKGWTQDYLAGRASCTRQTVNNFFARRAVNKNIFQSICNELGLEWGDVADLESAQHSIGMDAVQHNSSENIQEPSGTTQVLAAPTSIENKEQATRKAIFILSGTIDTVDQAKLKAIEAHLRLISADASLTITNLEEGSIKITLEGSSEGIERLQELFESGNLTEVLGIPVEDIQIENGDDSDNNESTQSKNQNPVSRRNFKPIRLLGYLILGYMVFTNLTGANLRGADLISADLSRASLTYANINEKTQIDGKWLLVWQIVNHQVVGRDLSNADLSDANLSNTDLSGANLSNTYLSGANLRNANLSGANLSSTDLRNANLSGANLSGADLSDVIVVNALFRVSIGLTQDVRRGLEQRGAIFGDRPPVLNPK